MQNSPRELNSGLIGDLAPARLAREAAADGILYRSGPFAVRLRCGHAAMLGNFQQMYSHHRLLDSTAHIADFSVDMQRPRGLRRWWRPQIRMRTDAQTPFEPFPLDHAFPLFEWSLNWVTAMQAHQFLALHSAVVEKDGVALIMPALPGSGKSTLCAALMLRGWRLLSDEFGLIRPDDPRLLLHPLPRPVPLKNASIEVIRDFAPDAVLGPTYPRTRKGDVAHLAATPQSQRQGDQAAPAGWFLFPRYLAGASLQIEPLARTWTFLKISGNSFNYKLQGARGFRTVAALVKNCPAYRLSYSDLDQATSQIEALHLQVIQQRALRAAPAAR
jgi:HprK-related kinase A